MPNRKYLLKGLNDTVVKAYFGMMVDTVMVLGAKDKARVESEMMEALLFETDLANVIGTRLRFHHQIYSRRFFGLPFTLDVIADGGATQFHKALSPHETERCHGTSAERESLAAKRACEDGLFNFTSFVLFSFHFRFRSRSLVCLLYNRPTGSDLSVAFSLIESVTTNTLSSKSQASFKV